MRGDACGERPLVAGQGRLGCDEGGLHHRQQPIVLEEDLQRSAAGALGLRRALRLLEDTPIFCPGQTGREAIFTRLPSR